MARIDGRRIDELRKIEILPSPQKDPAGSVLIQWGQTKVVCSVMIDEKVPHWMQAQGEAGGWITAEYGMLPGSSDRRIQRDKIRQTGRTHEIQRLIGRSIRAAMDMKKLGTRTVQIDCDVLQADGGTRVASITGGYLAFRMALQKLREKKLMKEIPETRLIAAVSLGRVEGNWALDLNYAEDVKAEIDANVVMNDKNEFIEIQGTGEKGSFPRSEMEQLLDLSMSGCRQLFEIQRKYLNEWGL